MRRPLQLGLLGLVVAAFPASAGTSPDGFLQPADSRDGLLLELAGRTAAVHHRDGRTERIRLRPAERLLSFEELESGWISAGIRLLDGAAELLLVERGPSGLHRLRVPPAGTTDPLLRTRPVALVEGGRLAGLAWLEGPPGDPLTVRVAWRSEEGWGPPITVSRPGRGSQTGLTGGVLPDGRWLLAWSRFDGQDDELVWSVGDAGGWSPPRAVGADNETPDIAPALYARGDLVLLAWSRLVDGEYRVLTTRWTGSGWAAARTVGGPGTLYPVFTGLDGDPYLLMREARTGSWTVLDLDRAGAALRRLRLETASVGRPALADSSGTMAGVLAPGSSAPSSAVWEAVER